MKNVRLCHLSYIVENGIEIVTANANEEDGEKDDYEEQEPREEGPGYMTTIREETHL